MSNSSHEESAQKAVEYFLRTAFGEQRQSLWNARTLEALGYISQAAHVEPLVGGRRNANGHPMDWVAPSFWHAAAALLEAWARTRLREESLTPESANQYFGAHWVFRGQANPWPILPSALRTQLYRQHNHNFVEALRSYVATHLPEEEIAGLSEYANLSHFSNAAAMGQHYGLPTHWVDFTFHPLVALHFASLDANAAAPANHPLPGHGVIYRTRFGKLQRMQDVGLIDLHLELLPPWVMKRWYQQSGFHVSCPDESEDQWKSFTDECEAIHFPRHYPKLSQKAHVLDEASIAGALAPPDDPFYAVQTKIVLHRWYPSEPFIEDAIAAIVGCCAKDPRGFNADRALHAARKAKRVGSPWMNSMIGVPRTRIGMIMADPMRIAMHYLFEASSVHTPVGVHLDPAIAIAFGSQNRRLFDTLADLSQSVDLFGLPLMCDLVAEAADRWNDWVDRRSTTNC
ncbi:FRG domain-containing protein [Aquincola sp. S2]|uniref:FRG domain-containing protein n=1 Tax=Pseudaquabacterium terrae TaxID=2732868 RepID=A0ABX2E9T4_9BURK|nr:FRG domain-containing protein [Aquabacterium terrae]NRF65784.1 FRG domain-containing protein [Aquabacterium terrae]